MVPIGTTRGGAEVLVDLEAAGVLSVDGPPELVTGWLRAIAVGASTACWAVQPRVVLVGMTGDLTALPWVETVGSVRDPLSLAAGEIAETSAMLSSLGCATTGQARAVGETPDAWEPTVIVSLAAPTELDGGAAEMIAARPHHTVGVAISAGSLELGRRAVITPEGFVVVDGVDIEVRARLLDDSDTRLVAELLADAAAAEPEMVTPDAVPIDPARVVPALVAADHVDDGEINLVDRGGVVGEPMLATLLAEVDVLVRVLGDVTITRRVDGSDAGAVETLEGQGRRGNRVPRLA